MSSGDPRQARVLSKAWRRAMSRRVRHATGIQTWATKSYEVWLVLQTELFLVRPKMLVEFGSGRSTTYLAEYAFKMGGRLLSIEEHPLYTRKANRVLKDSFLPDDLVHRVAVRDAWYDRAEVSRLLDELEAPIDFVLLDGPSSWGAGHRGARGFEEVVLPRLGAIQLAVVDDVHRPECDATAMELQKAYGLERRDMAYGTENSIAFMTSPTASERLKELPSFLSELLKPAGLAWDADPT